MSTLDHDHPPSILTNIIYIPPLQLLIQLNLTMLVGLQLPLTKHIVTSSSLKFNTIIPPPLDLFLFFYDDDE
jgi:hypothetical protein